MFCEYSHLAAVLARRESEITRHSSSFILFSSPRHAPSKLDG